ncbi:hypothetical protein QTO34_014384 [Cnephaeus nilssonii]|uniref:Rho-GAP domain-containing protein n=1 Tax=Cnephaeus nilssonii TaxID=3371016 RepID=A0AA40LS86_CNENI|nr:hypothetical protein QTO34_014384 [Eptesicus nilssonii]
MKLSTRHYQGLRIPGSERDDQLWTVHSQHKDQRIPPGLPTSESLPHRTAALGGTGTVYPAGQLPSVATQLNNSDQKTFKRRSIINWAFGTVLSVPVPSICEDDNLSKLVSHMLFLSLNLKGPSQKASSINPNVKSPRELKEKLNSRVEVHLDCESVFVLASVLKVFLQNIPGTWKNGLNVDVDVPCSDLVKNLDRGNRIMDCVLTISDDDLEQPEVDGLLTLT